MFSLFYLPTLPFYSSYSFNKLVLSFHFIPNHSSLLFRRSFHQSLSFLPPPSFSFHFFICIEFSKSYCNCYFSPRNICNVHASVERQNISIPPDYRTLFQSILIKVSLASQCGRMDKFEENTRFLYIECQANIQKTKIDSLVSG